MSVRISLETQLSPLEARLTDRVAPDAERVGLADRLHVEDAVLQRRVAAHNLHAQRDAVRRDELAQPRQRAVRGVEHVPGDLEVGQVAAEHGLRRLRLRLVRRLVEDRLKAILPGHPLQLHELEGPDRGRWSRETWGVSPRARNWASLPPWGLFERRRKNHALLGSSLARARRRGSGGSAGGSTQRAHGGSRGPSPSSGAGIRRGLWSKCSG